MGNDITSWRMSVGLFYTKAYGYITKQLKGKLIFSFQFFLTCFKIFRINVCCEICLTVLHCLELATIILLLVRLAGDVHVNPGPIYSEHSVSLFT